MAAYIIWSRLAAWMLPEDLEDGEEAEEEQHESAAAHNIVVHEDGTIDAEDQVFLPLWWPRKLPLQPFTSSDPTWQEFAKLSKDKDRLAAVKDAPPPSYVRPGISVIDDGIALTEQIMPHSDYVRMRHLAYPGAFITAIKAAGSYYFGLKLAKMKFALGMEVTQKDRHLVTVRAQTEQKLAQVDALQKAVQRRDQLDQGSEKAGPPSGAGQPSSTPGGGAGEGDSWWNLPNLTVPVISPPMTLDCSIAVSLGMATWRKAWHESREDFMPPGAMFFEGIIEIVGSQRMAKCSLVAAYDPKTRDIVYVKPPKALRVVDNVQRAKGGSGGPRPF
ncbi:hypothetical protein FH972_025930 [Carpinus fangiana]|uniref:Uncharacterized protein n=1 Tax=Carpinus fangiana TaxID=176857 RepID=A0A5N6L523_9ROSI|nr:hypothetical protein FH972_025930 [Carpinus fangiana]